MSASFFLEESFADFLCSRERSDLGTRGLTCGRPPIWGGSLLNDGSNANTLLQKIP